MELNLPTLLLGFTWAISASTFTKAAKQTYMCWHRSRRINAYIVMIWLEWTTCLIVSLASWMYLENRIHPSLGYYFGMLVMWVIEVQCITQIIINRVSLIMFNPRRVSMLKWGVAIFIGVINISVFCTWIPAHLHASPEIMRANLIWDRTEKCIFLVLELCLNGYFMWLIRSELVSNGLTKYNVLFKFNVAMVLLSVALDAVIIGVMSLPNDLIHPVPCALLPHQAAYRDGNSRVDSEDRKDAARKRKSNGLAQQWA
ncbi:hypothetical protein GE09DRAFT_683866 [Coniochaeta sp. 2T2.1]|nr:hypothetical protein GE09DRAFT_683866 [Coniochaeta sp. 2T2.1]